MCVVVLFRCNFRCWSFLRIFFFLLVGSVFFSVANFIQMVLCYFLILWRVFHAFYFIERVHCVITRLRMRVQHTLLDANVLTEWVSVNIRPFQRNTRRYTMTFCALAIKIAAAAASAFACVLLFKQSAVPTTPLICIAPSLCFHCISLLRLTDTHKYTFTWTLHYRSKALNCQQKNQTTEKHIVSIFIHLSFCVPHSLSSVLFFFK